MIEFFICLMISVMTGFGMAILLVEKGKEWPIRPWRIRLQLILRKIHWKLARLPLCTTCSSFYLTLIGDVVICIVAHLCGVGYFFWPLSGFITCGITWTIIEFLNGIDKEQNINVFIDNKGEENEN